MVFRCDTVILFWCPGTTKNPGIGKGSAVAQTLVFSLGLPPLGFCGVLNTYHRAPCGFYKFNFAHIFMNIGAIALLSLFLTVLIPHHGIDNNLETETLALAISGKASLVASPCRKTSELRAVASVDPADSSDAPFSGPEFSCEDSLRDCRIDPASQKCRLVMPMVPSDERQTCNLLSQVWRQWYEVGEDAESDPTYTAWNRTHDAQQRLKSLRTYHGQGQANQGRPNPPPKSNRRRGKKAHEDQQEQSQSNQSGPQLPSARQESQSWMALLPRRSKNQRHLLRLQRTSKTGSAGGFRSKVEPASEVENVFAHECCSMAGIHHRIPDARASRIAAD